jgi:hypothetical protein
MSVEHLGERLDDREFFEHFPEREFRIRPAHFAEENTAYVIVSRANKHWRQTLTSEDDRITAMGDDAIRTLLQRIDEAKSRAK